MNRRTFLQNLAGGVGTTILLNEISFGRDLSKYGLQLYTVRKIMAQDFEGTLRRVSELGIKEVEFVGYFNQAPSLIKDILKKHGLAAPSAHLGFDALQGKLEKAIEQAKVIGHKYLVFPSPLPKNRKSLDDYKKFADLLNEAGKKLRREGLHLGYHNHDFEFQEIEGRIPYDLLLEGTNPDDLKFEMDLYWITKAGFDPVTYFEKYPKRFSLVHVKDMDSTQNKSFTEVGRGVIDFKKIFSKAGKAGIKHYFIEQDTTPSDPVESVKISLEYLRRAKL